MGVHDATAMGCPPCRCQSGSGRWLRLILSSHAGAVERSSRPVQGVRVRKLFQKHAVRIGPHTGHVPLTEPPPARPTAAVQRAFRHAFPRQTGTQYRIDPCQRRSIRGPRTTALRLRRFGRQECGDHCPNALRDKSIHAARPRRTRLCPLLLKTLPPLAHPLRATPEHL